MRTALTALVLTVALGLASLDAASAAPASDGSIRDQLRHWLEIVSYPKRFVCRGELLCGTALMPQVYRDRDFRPLWVTQQGVSPQGLALRREIQRAPLEGLDPQAYHLGAIDTLIDAWRRNGFTGGSDPKTLAELDLFLTDAFLMYASHLLAGRVDPETVQTEWVAYEHTEDLEEILRAALVNKDITGAFQRLRPPHPGYVRLEDALRLYRHIAGTGGWPEVPAGPLMKPGDRDVRLLFLRKRLQVTGDLPADGTMTPLEFDEGLERAVRHFQRRHGLMVDGVVGPETLTALNVSAEERVRQLELNLERWRWLPHTLDRRYIMINVADFNLQVVENGHTVLEMRVIAGKPYWKTPAFKGTMTYLVFNPYWQVPYSIAVREIIPKVKKDPHYLESENIRVVKGWGDNAVVIDPASINWSRVDGHGFAYRFRQDPGPHNALGRIKFMFPNRFNVYLHDTPAQQLFRRAMRGFSHGCVRIEKPIDLAVYVLRDAPGWGRQQILDAIALGVHKEVPLPRPLSVHLLYWTAWVDPNGTVQFRRDIYQRDGPLDRALHERPPEAIDAWIPDRQSLTSSESDRHPGVSGTP
jgi:murein L,D-transpeptidase YcbB/YkuD